MKKQTSLFNTYTQQGAAFSDCRKYRYALWRIWDERKPFVMFIGLNPSTADENGNDNTIESVERLSRYNGFGGFYMMNCFAYVSTDPNQLIDVLPGEKETNFDWLQNTFKRCKDVVFAWGAFSVVAKYQRDTAMTNMFPNAKCITKNKDGSPGHPLYKKGKTKFIEWK